MNTIDDDDFERKMKLAGERLKMLRIKKYGSLSNYSIASDQNLKNAYKTEKGVNNPKISSLMKAAAAYDMKLSELVAYLFE